MSSSGKAQIFFVVFILSYTMASSEVTSVNPDEFVDKLLSKIRPEIEKHLDPVKLPSSKESFEVKIFPFTIKGVLEAYKGQLYGLKTLKRFGKAKVWYQKEGIAIDAILQLKNLFAHYGLKARINEIGPWFDATANVSTALIHMKLFETHNDKKNFTLTEFKIEKVGDVTVDVNGLGPALDFILKHAVTFVTNLVKDAIASAIDNPLKKLVQTELSKL